MKIDFYNSSVSFLETSYRGVSLKGNLKRINGKITNLEAEIYGKISYFCNRCGKDIVLNLNEKVNIALSDGVCEIQTLDNVIEFFDGKINFEEIIQSEVEAFKSDYFYCEDCIKE